MKKTTFYTRMHFNHKVQAVQVDGYTDGTFNYYRNKFGQWHAIIPGIGLSVSGAMVYTRKAAQVIAHEGAVRIAEFMQAHGEAEAVRFAKMIDEAQNIIV